jgi:protocatechuate 3,4-dioxygenase beta subunit
MSILNAVRIVLTRRRALGWLGGAGALAALGCGDDEKNGATGGDGGLDAGYGGAAQNVDASTEASACTPAPEGEVGPYFADDSDPRFNRSNILSNLDGSNTQGGVPLTLTIFVLDATNGCLPYAGAQVDIWHCNASGVYSDEASQNSASDQWLRGYQVTDTTGKVTFATIMPGWYPGRTTHIHLRLRSSHSEAAGLSDGSNTTQLFFEQSVDDDLATQVAPYNAEGKNPTTNASDHVYSQEESGANQLVLSGDATGGYVATVTLFLPITSNGAGPDADGGLGFGPPPGFDGGLPPGPNDGG